MNGLSVDQKILKARFERLGWTAYRLAQSVSEVRSRMTGEPPKKAANLITAVEKVIDNPNTSSFQNVEATIRAMGGEIVIRWQNTEEIVTGHEEIRL